MRKLLTLTIALLINIVAFGQRAVHTQATIVNGIKNDNTGTRTYSNARTTAVGDTLILTNIPAADTPLVVYNATANGGGYLTGTDTFGDEGFAELYSIDVAGVDSSIVVIGVVAQFYGTVNPASMQTITFDAWDVSIPQIISATTAYSGFPNDNLDSLVVPVTQLGIGTGGDTIKAFFFPNATVTLQNSFFVGYTINYNYAFLAGDTLGLACSQNGDRSGSNTFTYATYTDSVVNAEGTADSAIFVTDTLINVQNATQWSDGVWHDNYTDNDSLLNNLAIYPIVVVGNPTAVKGIKRNSLTFFGNYPNPAVSTTNIKFSLLQSADVTIRITDMNGRVISSINNTNLSAGEHVVPVNTAAMPAGDYLYIIRTSGGDGIASKMTVVK